MNADVEKAVERFGSHFAERASSLSLTAALTSHEWQTIRQALRDQEAEIAGNDAENAELVRALDMCRIRAEKAEALLLEALSEVQSHIGYMGLHNVNDGSLEASVEVWNRITAHLGGEQ